MKVSKESLVLITVGMVDLSTTLWWVSAHGALEANPIFSHYLAMGPAIFAMMKIVLLLAPVFLLEWARRRRPQFTISASRFAIAAYVSLYLAGVVRLNPELIERRPAHQSYAEIAQIANTNDPINGETVRHLRYMMRIQKLGLVE